MKRWLGIFLVAAIMATAADITIAVRNDAGKTVSTVTLTTTDAILTALDTWRKAQQARDAQGNPVPAYPTVEALWRTLVGSLVRSAISEELAAIKTEQAKIQAAQAEIERLRAAAVK